MNDSYAVIRVLAVFCGLLTCSCTGDMGDAGDSAAEASVADTGSDVPGTDVTCHPSCDGMHCGGADGCGGMCGCPGTMVCSTANTCCTPENGAAACNTFVGAWCDRVVMCCSAMGPTACMSWAYASATCQGHYVSQGYNCADTSWTSRSVCTETATRCSNDIPLVACSDIVAGTANFPASCH